MAAARWSLCIETSRRTSVMAAPAGDRRIRGTDDRAVDRQPSPAPVFAVSRLLIVIRDRASASKARAIGRHGQGRSPLAAVRSIRLVRINRRSRSSTTHLEVALRIQPVVGLAEFPAGCRWRRRFSRHRRPTPAQTRWFFAPQRRVSRIRALSAALLSISMRPRRFDVARQRHAQ